jgi:hypothetical protein
MSLMAIGIAFSIALFWFAIGFVVGGQGERVRAEQRKRWIIMQAEIRAEQRVRREKTEQ